ncbi:MAG: filamentous hemagglutinin N-terminal domain-containing protein [Lyngbya sp. HA4199-MV5]|jgi:filamentous hemagglutinin family protein|nr:filamentous hemagglutinin N-terminal domain-containing protein [Lyngbya sp. HA4199-MV5]
MKKYSVVVQQCANVIRWVGVVCAITAILPDRTMAQIVPDASLGTERSVVRPNTVIRGLPSDRIDGGAIRGSNLFHSFQQFNIGEGRGAYFANPAGIENILSRVTGNTRSEILGRLGVLGNANLFFLNPNGIVFGANASLDVAGSFTATTANAIKLGDQGFFSATQPAQSSLLAIAPGALFFDQQLQQPRTIQNSGTLIAGRNLTLAADNLELQGQLRSGGDLTLKAQDTVRIRDSATNPFIASAGRNLLVQGDRLVDIFALNHPNSGLFSGGNMVLRSAAPIIGDSHFTSGGNLWVEQLDHSLGRLTSPNDPVFQVLGDFSLFSYSGTSLQILAGGSVFIPGGVTITGAGGGFNDSEIQLSDGTRRTILGSTIPTLEIRAGTTEFFLASPLFAGSLPPSGANIVIGNVTMTAFGGVLLTNQIAPNALLSPGVIVTGGIQTAGGEAIIDASGGILTTGAIDVSIANGKGGDITLFGGLGGINTRGGNLRSISANGSAGNITLAANQTIATAGIQSYVGAGGTGDGGNIAIISSNGSVDTSAGTLYSSATNGNGGTVTINAAGDVLTAGIQSLVGTGGRGQAGAVTITSRGGSINTTALAPDFSGNTLTTGIQSLVGANASGYGGNVTLTALGNIITRNIESRVGAGSAGFSGNITLFSALGSIDTTAGTLSSSTENGISGKITFDAFGDIFAGNVQAFSTGTTVGQAGEINIRSINGAFFLSGKQVTSQASGVAEGGNISISAKSVFLTNRAYVASSTFGQGNAGDLISVLADDTVSLSGSSQIRGTVEPGGNGKASDIFIRARALLLTGGSQVQTELFRTATDPTTRIVTPGGRGQGGNIGVVASDLVYISGTSSNGFSSGLLSLSERGASGSAGNITVDVGTSNFNNAGAGLFRVESGGAVIASTRNNGNGGNITINSRTFEALAGGQILAASGNRVDARGTTTGSAGIITVNAIDRVTISGRDPNFQDRLRKIDQFVRSPDARGTTRQDVLIREFDTSGLFVDTRDAGAGGSVAVTTAGSFSLSNGALINSATSGQGGFANAGNIFISGGSISLQNRAQLQVQTSGVGNAGLVFLQAPGGAVSLDNSTIFSSVQPGAVGNAGGIVISGASISLKNVSQLQAQTGGTGNAGLVFLQAPNGAVSLDNRSVVFSSVLEGAVGIAGGILLQAGSFSATNASGLTTSTFGKGDAGLISVQTSGEVSLRGRGSGIFSAVGGNSTNKGGGIEVLARNVALTDGAAISVANGGLEGAAGNIEIATRNVELDRNSIITGATLSGKGGNVQIDSREYILLRRNSNISTSAGLRPSDGDGGKITITTPFIIAVPSRNSNIRSQAFTGAGGIITINDINGGTGLFGIARRSGDFLTSNDITTSSRFGASGITVITALNTSVIENNLAELAQQFIDPNTLLANSCIVRNREKKRESGGVFQITGSGGLPVRPGDAPTASFPTGDVRSLPEAGSRESGVGSSRAWQPGDPIAEPQGIYRLANGKLVMSRECAP